MNTTLLRARSSVIRTRGHAISTSISPCSSAVTIALNSASMRRSNSARRVFPIRTHTTAGPSRRTLRTAKSSSFVTTHGVNLGRVAANRFIGRSCKLTLDDVLRRVSERVNAPSQRRWQLSVDEKAQSRAPQDGVIVLAGGEFEYRGDVFGFEVGIVGEDLVPRRTGREKVEDVLHADTEAANARATRTDLRAHRNSVNRAHILAAAGRPPERAILPLLRVYTWASGAIESRPESDGIPT
jgi:hypothetical protein